MEKYWMIAIAIFVAITLLVRQLTIGSFKKEYGEKMRKVWGQRTFYWQDVILISTGITFLVLVVLDWASVLILSA